MENMSNNKQSRKKLNWKQKIVRELERVENLLPQPQFMQDDWPEWTKQMARELFNTVVPGMKCGNPNDPTANELGRLVAVKRASMRDVEEWEPTDKEWEAFEKLLERQWGEKAEEKFMEQLEFMEKTFFPAY